MNLVNLDKEKVEVLKQVCKRITSSSTRSNVLYTKNLVKDDKIKEHFCKEFKGTGPNAVIGSILANADWATQWNKGKYIIDVDKI